MAAPPAAGLVQARVQLAWLSSSSWAQYLQGSLTGMQGVASTTEDGGGRPGGVPAPAHLPGPPVHRAPHSAAALRRAACRLAPADFAECCLAGAQCCLLACICAAVLGCSLPCGRTHDLQMGSSCKLGLEPSWHWAQDYLDSTAELRQHLLATCGADCFQQLDKQEVLDAISLKVGLLCLEISCTVQPQAAPSHMKVQKAALQLCCRHLHTRSLHLNSAAGVARRSPSKKCMSGCLTAVKVAPAGAEQAGPASLIAAGGGCDRGGSHAGSWAAAGAPGWVGLLPAEG